MKMRVGWREAEEEDQGEISGDNKWQAVERKHSRPLAIDREIWRLGGER